MAYPFFLTRLLIRTGLARFLPGVRRLIGDGASFLHYYSDRTLAAPHMELSEAARFLEPYDADAIDLAAGAPRFDLSAVPRSSDRNSGSPWGLPELRAAVAERVSAEHGLRVHSAQQVLITHGAAGAFGSVLDALVNPGDRVVLLDPTSPLYGLALRQRRARIRWVPAVVEDGRLRFRLDRLAGALHGARLLVLADPANPTGGVLAAEDLEQIAWWADHHDVPIVYDESFARFRYDGERIPLCALPKAQRRTLLLGSVSKGHGLASIRVGWLCGHSHLVKACAVSAGLHSAGVAPLCQQLALVALQQDESNFNSTLREYTSRRAYVNERLTAMGLRTAWPAGAFFFWVPVGPLGFTGRAFAARLLREKKVLVVPGELFGPSGAGYIRLSYTADDGRLREGLTRIAELVRGVACAAPVHEPVAA